MFVYFLLSVFSAYIGAPTFFDLGARDETMNEEYCNSHLKRTLFGIVWSCISTTILCAWTAVHPNVPPRSSLHAGWNRLRLMFWMIVAPELVLAWAVRQLFAAKDIRDTYNNSREGIAKWNRWTLVQGHLLGMGGFTLVNPDLKGANPLDQNGRVLTNDRFEQLISNPEFEFPDVTERDIRDRSKGDGLFKIIAILQTTWFIIQCVARGHQRLGLTELELVTLALASLNAVTFGIWWYKPLGVQEPVRIYLRIETAKIEDAEQENRGIRLSFRDVLLKDWTKVNIVASTVFEFFQSPCKDGPIIALVYLFIVVPIFLIYIITFPFFLLFPLGIIFLHRILKTEPTTQNSTQSRGLLAARIVASLQGFRYSLSSVVGDFVGARMNKILARFFSGPSDFFGGFLLSWFIFPPFLFTLLLLFVIFLIPFLTFLFLVSFVFTSVFGIVTSSTVRPGASHVPSFYAPTTKSDRWSRMVVFALFGVIFGGIHCIGWYFSYPTNADQTLWRSASLAITVIPLIVAPIDFLLTVRLHNRNLNSCKKLERIALLILDLIMTILLFIYVPARLSLIAQALVLLRKQPPTALVAVDWTKYIPHLFSQ